jgi:predicted short-subunit dehydrogenase-like oxidoreductase (DUF2520 family)
MYNALALKVRRCTFQQFLSYMDIVIIGTGNTATVLGRKLRAAGHRIVQVFGRDSAAASDLAYQLGTESTNYWNVVNRQADIYLLAVSDIAIREIVTELNFPEKTIVHTAASVPGKVLEGSASHFGVFYPLQSLRKERGRLPETPIIIDASDPETFSLLDKLAHSITDSVVQADDEARAKMHLAAVICNNFVNHLYVLAAEYCEKEGLDFKMLLPLIKETALRLEELSPAAAQTGPAARRDVETLDRHMALLANHPELKEIYRILTESIMRAH